VLPVAFDADMAAWRKILDVFAGCGRKNRFVPGDGPVCRIDIVRQQMDLMDDLEAHAGKMTRAGVPLEEAKRRYTAPERYREFAVSSWRWTIGAAIESYYC
jgi:hypothetical protein